MSKQKVEKTVLTILLFLVVLDVSKYLILRQNVVEAPQGERKSAPTQQPDGASSNTGDFSGTDGNTADESFENFKREQMNSQQQQGARSQRQQGSFTGTANVYIGYCIGCQYKQNYQQVESALLQSFPNLEVSGGEHPQTPIKAAIAKLATYAQYAGIAISMFGDKLFSMLSMPYPEWYLKVREKKWQFLMMTYFGGNMLSQYLTQTGAFEVYLNDELIFSKIQTGRLPEADQIVYLVKEALRGGGGGGGGR